MANTNWQDPGAGEITSTQISGLQDSVGKLETALGAKNTSVTGLTLTKVTSSPDYRIYQAPPGQRSWVASPAPVIKKNGVTISSGFTIDYGGGAIVMDSVQLSTDTFTADVTYVSSYSSPPSKQQFTTKMTFGL